MEDLRDKRIARHKLEEAAWLCQEVGIEKDDAVRIIVEHYESVEREKREVV